MGKGETGRVTGEGRRDGKKNRRQERDEMSYYSSYNYHHVDIFHYGILAYICGGVRFKSDLNIAEQNSHVTDVSSPVAGCSLLLLKSSYIKENICFVLSSLISLMFHIISHFFSFFLWF